MKTISFFTILLILSLTTSCIEPDCCDVVQSQEFFVNLQNTESANLLDPQTAGAVDLSKTRLFLLEDGEAKMVKYESPGAVLDYPYGVISFEENGEYGVKFFFEYDGNRKELEGFIQWNDRFIDTLTFTFNSAENPRHLVKISQNRTPLWDMETDLEYPVSITLIR
ncbi:hypothetical protein GCM10009119_19750 [Algoriphagus jejuensis]|uniref:Uncharacterized protein n=1 Tax=Algoriphagus jejuensis TaxID=419934 RepID=A0ABP3YD15_9BACT